MKQKIIVSLTIVFLLCLLVAPAFGTQSLYSSNPTMASYSYTGTVNDGGYGFSLAGTGNVYLDTVSFYIGNHTASANTGLLSATIMNATSGNGTRIENSTNTYDVADMTGGYVWVNFTFSQTTELALSTTYYIALMVNTSLAETVRVGITSGGKYYKVNLADTWHYAASGKPCYYVYVENVEGGGTPPADDPGPTEFTTTDALIGNVVSFIIPIVIILLPVLLLVTITRSTDKWIILIGITIGAALGYFFNLVPMWVVFLVVIGLIGMAYQSVRGGG